MSVNGEMKITRTASSTTVVRTICTGLTTSVIMMREVYVFKRIRELLYTCSDVLGVRLSTCAMEIRRCSTPAVGGKDLNRTDGPA